MFPSFGLATGGGGASAASGIGDTNARSGDIGGNRFSFEGINTGARGGLPEWVLPAALLVVGAIVALRFLRK